MHLTRALAPIWHRLLLQCGPVGVVAHISVAHETQQLSLLQIEQLKKSLKKGQRKPTIEVLKKVHERLHGNSCQVEGCQVACRSSLLRVGLLRQFDHHLTSAAARGAKTINQKACAFIAFDFIAGKDA